MPGGDVYGNVTSSHGRIIQLMEQAQNTTNETEANRLIGEAQAAAQQLPGTNQQGQGMAAIVFEAVTKHAQEIQARNVALRPGVVETTATSAPTSSGGGGGGYHVSAVPTNYWVTTPTYTAPTGVKQATPDIIVFDDMTVDIEYLTNDYFEQFGGQELIKISRSDLIDGKEVVYNPIKNLSVLNQKYNPNTVIAIAPFQQNLSLHAIDLILRGIHEPYIDRENGYLVIEIDNVKKTESIEVEIAIDGTMNRVVYDY